MRRYGRSSTRKAPTIALAPSLKRWWTGSAILPGIPAGRQLGEGGSKVCGLVARVVIVSDSNAYPIPFGSRIPWGFSFPCPFPLHKFSFSHSLSLHTTPKGGDQRRREREKKRSGVRVRDILHRPKVLKSRFGQTRRLLPPHPLLPLFLLRPICTPRNYQELALPTRMARQKGCVRMPRNQGWRGARARAFGYKRHRRLTRCVRAWAGRGLDEPKRCWPLPCVLR